MQRKLLNILSENNKSLALLIDPDKHSEESLKSLVQHANKHKYPNVILVGGSLLFENIGSTIKKIKSLTDKPVYIFPGNNCDVSNESDGILLLSLISGRNAEFLIGNHVLAAPKLKKSKIDIVPVGYTLIDCGAPTSVSYMSNTTPIPHSKNDIAVATTMAGEMLGLKAIYLEGGSGAIQTVSTDMIKSVKQNINIPLIVGGGIRTPEILDAIFSAGADIAVIGNCIEENPELLDAFANITDSYR